MEMEDGTPTATPRPEWSNHSMTPWGSLYDSQKMHEEEPTCKYSPFSNEISSLPPPKVKSLEEVPKGLEPSVLSMQPATPEAQIGLPDILKPRYFFGWDGGGEDSLPPNLYSSYSFIRLKS